MRLVSIHGFDPRGPKVGGIETHVRQLLRRHPSDMRPLLIGIDDFGDLELGKLITLPLGETEIDFIPVVHIASNEQTGAARRVRDSVTLRFAAGILRYLPRIRRLLKGEAAVAEIERYEYAPIARALGCPVITLNHNEGDPRTDKMDSILSRYWYINSLAERIALALSARVYGVTPRIRERIATLFPRYEAKTDVLTVSVDTEVFRPSPFDTSDGVLRLMFAGRLDEFKNPPLMFRVALALNERLQGRFEFHYCGSADPHRYPEFAAIEAFTVRHGRLPAEGVAAVMARAHMGILVSHFEGMPCFLLELLASGRPITGIRLAQFDQMVQPSLNGSLIERGATEEETLKQIVEATMAQWEDIRAGRLDPEAIHATIQPWSIKTQLTRLFTALRDVARPGRPVSATAAA